MMNRVIAIAVLVCTSAFAQAWKSWDAAWIIPGYCSADRALDLTGHGNDLTNIYCSFSSAGYAGDAYLIRTGGQLRCVNYNCGNYSWTQPFYVAVFAAYTNDVGYPKPFMTKALSGSPYTGWIPGVYTAGEPYYQIYGNATINQIGIRCTNSWKDGKFHFFEFISTTTLSSGMQIWVDRVQQGTTYFDPSGTGATVELGPITNGIPLGLGCSDFGSVVGVKISFAGLCGYIPPAAERDRVFNEMRTRIRSGIP